MSAVQPDLEERFAFDPAHNLLDKTLSVLGRVEGNRVTVFQDKRYAYDAHGNLTSKLMGKHTRLSLEWNAAHQLVKSAMTRHAQQSQPTVQTLSSMPMIPSGEGSPRPTRSGPPVLPGTATG